MLEITLAQCAALTPALSYAASCFFFEFIDALGLFKKYRVLPTDEETNLNRVSRTTVLRHVIVYHIFLTMGALAFNEIVPPAVECKDCLGTRQYWVVLFEAFYPTNATLLMCLAWTARLLWLVGRQFLALAVIDAWVFWWHYFTHKNTWLYRNVHAVHHRLYVPFSYGALYNHWADSIFGDYVAGVLGVYLIRLTAHEQMFFLWLVIFKVVEDHAACELPWSPSTLLGRLTGCTSTYHHVHHQSWGIKNNFSPYFTWWDHLMGTTYHGNRSLIKSTESQSRKKRA